MAKFIRVPQNTLGRQLEQMVKNVAKDPVQRGGVSL